MGLPGAQVSPWKAYEWIVVVGGAACFWSGWTIGKNYV